MTMPKFKLSPVFMLAVLAVAFAVPLLAGVSMESISAATAVVVGSAFLVEPAGAGYTARRAFGQAGEVGGENIEKEYKEVKASLDKVSDQLKTHAENAEKEIKAHARLSEETKASVDKLLTEQGELRARLQAAEQLIVKMDGGTPTNKRETMGSIVAQSDEFKTVGPRMVAGKGSFSVPVQAAVTSTQSDSSDGYPVEPMRVPGIIGLPERRLTIRDLLNWGPTASNSVEFVRETGFSNNADVVSENPTNNKPESDITFELDSENVATIAHWIHASKQVLSDQAMLQAYIDGRLRYGLRFKEEAQLLKGSGVGLNINGLYTQATTYANPGVTVASETSIDTLRIAMLQVQLAEYMADGIVLNPIDWCQIELTKDNEARYIWANPNAVNGPTLWGLPVVATQSMTASDFLVGAFAMGAQGWDREDTTVTVSTEDRDNFVKNMVTILAEERIALTVYRPEAFVKGDLSAS